MATRTNLVAWVKRATDADDQWTPHMVNANGAFDLTGLTPGATYDISIPPNYLSEQFVADSAPSVQNVTAITTTGGTAVTVTPSYGGTNRQYSLSGPAWLSIDAGNGRITGTAPLDGHTGLYTVTASNAAGSVSASAAITVSTTELGAASATLADFRRDQVVFDTGAARGLDAATVPLSGTTNAPDGAVIEARAVRADTGAEVATWTAAGTASGGAWSGTLSVARNGNWLRPEVRVQGNTATATTANRFGAGHCIDVWGQSEHERIVLIDNNETTPATVTHPGQVQIHTVDHDANTTATTIITDATPLTASSVALANALTAVRPDDLFSVTFHTLSGTGIVELVNDDAPGRAWSDEVLLHDHVYGDGGTAGLVTASWFASPSGHAGAYGQVFAAAFLGRDLTGTALEQTPYTLSWGPAPTLTRFDHDMREFYGDYSATRIAPYGPHRFDPNEDMDNAVTERDGGVNTGSKYVNIQAARASYRAMATALSPWVKPVGLEAINYENGHQADLSGAGTASQWTDHAHPNYWSEDGQPRFAQLLALTALDGLGFADWAIPEFDNAAWQADGSYMEVWSSAGPVTTTRIARGLAALGTTFPHWTDVVGFELNGAPVQRAEIVAGRVRIYPNDGGPFNGTETLTYGRGGASGVLEVHEDYLNGLWMNTPIVDTGAPGIEGLPVRPMPDPAVLANTVVSLDAATNLQAFLNATLPAITPGATVSKIETGHEVTGTSTLRRLSWDLRGVPGLVADGTPQTFRLQMATNLNGSTNQKLIVRMAGLRNADNSDGGTTTNTLDRGGDHTVVDTTFTYQDDGSANPAARYLYFITTNAGGRHEYTGITVTGA